LPSKAQKKVNSEYTVMIVPHHGKTVLSVKLPFKVIKYSLAGLCLCLAVIFGAFWNYWSEAKLAHADQVELERYRMTHNEQVKQIEQLTKATASLQEDMTRLNQLDAELRRMVNTEENTAVSRSGQGRPNTVYNGKGGPVVSPNVNELTSLVQEMQASVKVREESLTALKEALTEKKQLLAATPSIWPTQGEVTSKFGWRSSPWGWGSEWHPGIDIANDTGTPIHATADGRVIHSGWYGGYGLMVQIDHGYGIETLYGHNSRIAVQVGQTVKKGDVIAYMGSTGISTGSHCHYEVRVNGSAVNPANFL